MEGKKFRAGSLSGALHPASSFTLHLLPTPRHSVGKVDRGIPKFFASCANFRKIKTADCTEDAAAGKWFCRIQLDWSYKRCVSLRKTKIGHELARRATSFEFNAKIAKIAKLAKPQRAKTYPFAAFATFASWR